MCNRVIVMTCMGAGVGGIVQIVQNTPITDMKKGVRPMTRLEFESLWDVEGQISATV